jgi:hypothetical protein
MEVIEGSENSREDTSKKRLSHDDWMARRSTIELFYLTRDLTLSEVMKEMERLDFFAT